MIFNPEHYTGAVCLLLVAALLALLGAIEDRRELDPWEMQQMAIEEEQERNDARAA